MKSKLPKLSSSSVWMLPVLALNALAVPVASGADPGWYLGANVGESRASIDEEQVANGLLSSGFVLTAFSDDVSHFGYKALGGYQFSKYFALEAGYFNPGNFSFDAATQPAGTLRARMELQGGFIDAVGFLPFTEKFAAFARVGGNYAETEDKFFGTGAVNVLEPDHTRGKHDMDYKIGAGLQYEFTKTLAMRLEAERYRVDDAVGNEADIDMFTIGAVFRFGKPVPSEAPAISAVPVVTDIPVLVVVPAPTRMAQYCSILDFQFEINSDDIQREEKEKLAVVGTFLTKYPDTTAVIEGHTDNVGTAENNMQLSKRRAQSVVNYLLATYPIESSRLTAVGYGDTRPLADNGTEEGKRLNRRIGAVVACAPDVEGLQVVPARMTMALLIEFDRNMAEVRPEYRDELSRLANFLKANPAVTATVEGHTGNLQATAALAQEISQRRAQNVVNYLVDNFGIARSRLSAEGFGRTRRFAYNTSAEGQQENRRVNVIINYPK